MIQFCLSCYKNEIRAGLRKIQSNGPGFKNLLVTPFNLLPLVSASCSYSASTLWSGLMLKWSPSPPALWYFFRTTSLRWHCNLITNGNATGFLYSSLPFYRDSNVLISNMFCLASFHWTFPDYIYASLIVSQSLLTRPLNLNNFVIVFVNQTFNLLPH